MEKTYFLKGFIFISGIFFLWFFFFLFKKENRIKIKKIIVSFLKKILSKCEFFLRIILFVIIVFIGLILICIEFLINFFKEQEIIVSGEVMETFPEEYLIENSDNTFIPSSQNIIFGYRINVKTSKKTVSIFINKNDKILYDKINEQIDKPISLICHKNWYFGRVFLNKII